MQAMLCCALRSCNFDGGKASQIASSNSPNRPATDCSKHVLLCLLMAIVFSADVVAQAYIPSSPSAVLEQLPPSSDASSKVLKRLRTQLKAQPGNVDAAASLARLYIERSRREGDPRYLGYAQAVLAPWWNLSHPPVAILVLRATLLQSTHQFEQSLRDIDAVLKLEPANAQAWITRATILQVQGHYAEALKSCAKLYSLAPALITLTCSANIQNLNGQAVSSYRALKEAYLQMAQDNPAIQTWVLTLLAEMANRQGDAVAAEGFFKQAIQIEEPDSYLLGAYSDFLLDQQRPQEVIALLNTKTRVDPLLLRYAEALTAVKAPAASAQVEALTQRFDAAMLRGDSVHEREQSRFELRLRHNAASALALAQKNWQVQKEPADARVYLEAAFASGDKEAALPVIQWLALNRTEDVVLQKIIAQHKQASYLPTHLLLARPLSAMDTSSL